MAVNFRLKAELNKLFNLLKDDNDTIIEFFEDINNLLSISISTNWNSIVNNRQDFIDRIINNVDDDNEKLLLSILIKNTI